MKFSISTAMLCASVVMPTIAMAQVPGIEPDTGTNASDTIVVTASRIPLEPRQIGSALSVITTDDLKQGQIVFLKDVLQEVAGIWTSTDRPGDSTSVSIRGSDNGQVLWLLDGIKLGDPSQTTTAFGSENLTTRDIARVEVLRGNQSSLYGSDAIGGVINVITQRATEEGYKVNAEAEGGSYGTVNGGASLLGKSGPVDFRLTASGYSQDGPSLADPRTASAGRIVTEDDRYWRYSLSGRVGFQATDTLSFQLLGFWQKSRSDLDGTRTDSLDILRKKEYAIAAQTNYLSLDGKFRADASVSRYEAERRYAGPSYPTGNDRYTGTKDVGNVNFGYNGGIWSIAVGGSWEEEKIDQATSFSGDLGRTIETKSGYGELALRPVENLTITGAARIDDNSRFGTFDTYRGTIAYVIPDVAGANSVKLRASYGTGAKAPGLYQLFDPTYGNPNLKAQTSTGGDVGFDVNFDRFTAQISYFFTKTKNEIVFDGSILPFGGYRQFGRTRKQGVEVAFTLKPIDGVSINQSFTFLDATVDKRENGLYTDLGRPRHVGATSVTLTPIDRLSLTARARYRSRNALSGSGVTAAYATVDLLASYGITDRIEIYGRVTNLMDKDYQVSFAKNALGRAAYGGVRVSF